MSTRLQTVIVLCTAIFLLAIPGISTPQEQNAEWLKRKPTTALWVVSRGARCWQFNVWLARSPDEFTKGLMFVRAIPDDTGMLFAMNEPREIAMWMRNTYIPLDIIFTDEHGTILKIHENAVPHSLDYIRSEQAVSAVLELPGGTTKRRGIYPGDRLRHPDFGTSGCQDS